MCDDDDDGDGDDGDDDDGDDDDGDDDDGDDNSMKYLRHVLLSVGRGLLVLGVGHGEEVLKLPLQSLKCRPLHRVLERICALTSRFLKKLVDIKVDIKHVVIEGGCR